MKQYVIALLIGLMCLANAYAAVDINTASKADLEMINGIGPAKAQAIVDYRKKNGGFKSVDELEKVPGIGPATLANMKKDIRLGAESSKAVSMATDKAVKPSKPATQ